MPKPPSILAHALLALSACSGRAPTPAASLPPRDPALVVVSTPAAPAPVPTPAPAVVDAQPAAPEADPGPAVCLPRARALRRGERPLVVANERGLWEFGADGAPLRRISATAADRPRYTPDGLAVVFLVPERSEVRRVTLDDCRETRVAVLPRGIGARCGGIFESDYDPVTLVHADYDARLTRSGDALCLLVRDRNENMMSVTVQLRVSLADGAVTHRVVYSESCGELSEADYAALPCTPALRAPIHTAPVGTRSFPYALGESSVTRGGRAVAALGGSTAAVEQTSPSGRWQLVSVNREEGDYIYRQVLWFDRATGRLHPTAAGAFPPALTAAQRADLRSLRESLLTATGESPVRFTGVGDRALVGSVLIDPGVGGVDLGGSLAE